MTKYDFFRVKKLDEGLILGLADNDVLLLRARLVKELIRRSL